MLSALEELLTDAQQGLTRLLLSEMNLGEIFYMSAKIGSQTSAESILRIISNLPISIIPVVTGDALRAARLKALHPISYADAFCTNLALDHAAPVVTGDQDFLLLERAGLLTLRWLGA